MYLPVHPSNGEGCLEVSSLFLPAFQPFSGICLLGFQHILELCISLASATPIMNPSNLVFKKVLDWRRVRIHGPVPIITVVDVVGMQRIVSDNAFILSATDEWWRLFKIAIFESLNIIDGLARM